MRSRITAQITHQLNSGLGDISCFLEGIRIHDTMIGGIRCAQTREFAVCPVEGSPVNDNTANLQGMSIHIFCCAVNDDVRTETKRLTQDRRRKGIIDKQRNIMCMCDTGKFLNIQYIHGRVCHNLSKYRFRIRANQLFDFLCSRIRIHIGHFDAEFSEGDRQQID